MPQTLVLEDVVASAMDAALQGVWTAIPGRVESYDPVLQRANVQPVIKAGSVGESGNRQVESIAVINAVPVLHSGGGSFREVYPITRGDTVLLVFCSRSIDAWLTQGGIADPRDDHRHDLSDAVAIVGLRDFTRPLKNVPTDRASIGHDSGATIEFHQSELRLGSDSASSAVVVQDALDDFQSALDAATATLVGPAAAALAALSAQLTALNLGTGWKARTSKVKAE